MSNRTYSTAINDNSALPAFLYIYDSNATYTGSDGVTIQTGCNRLVTPIDFNGVGRTILNTNNNGSVSGAYGASVLPANSNRVQWYLQNIGTGALYVNLGTALPSTGKMNILLKGGSSNFDGNGQNYIDTYGIYKGAVSISGNMPNPTYVIWDI